MLQTQATLFYTLSALFLFSASEVLSPTDVRRDISFETHIFDLPLLVTVVKELPVVDFWLYTPKQDLTWANALKDSRKWSRVVWS